MNSLNNKWMRAAIPALLIHCSIGSVYCWSTFKESIAKAVGMSTFSVGWAFSLAIFFLGMSAAFAGRLVERDVHRSSLLSCIFFSVGMIGTGLFIQFTRGITALIGIFLCYGCIMGIGLGIGYLTPVKTLMLWFEDQKGLATGISIMGFGLAKALATPLMEKLQSAYPIAVMFYVLGAIYFIMMLTGHILLKKPSDWVETQKAEEFHVGEMFQNKEFLGIWLMFFLNIHCGLAVITYEKQILHQVFNNTAFLASAVVILPSVTALFNAFGRVGYSAVSDRMKERNSVYRIIFASSVLVTALAFFTASVANGSRHMVSRIIIVVLLLIVNAGYGGGFSTLPALLSSRFGMEKISKIHGLALSAWAVAGLTGNNASEFILRTFGNRYEYVLAMTGLLYLLAYFICRILVGTKNYR